MFVHTICLNKYNIKSVKGNKISPNNIFYGRKNKLTLFKCMEAELYFWISYALSLPRYFKGNLETMAIMET